MIISMSHAGIGAKHSICAHSPEPGDGLRRELLVGSVAFQGICECRLGGCKHARSAKVVAAESWQECQANRLECQRSRQQLAMRFFKGVQAFIKFAVHRSVPVFVMGSFSVGSVCSNPIVGC